MAPTTSPRQDNPARRPCFLAQKLTAEFLGSGLLVTAAITPMILVYQVLGGSLALAVLMDAVAVGFVLFALIEVLEPVSGCHINPAVTLSFMVARRMEVKTGLLYMLFQFLGGLGGTLLSHLMFVQEEFFRLLTVSQVPRQGGPYLAEFLGTFALVLAIHGCLARKSVRLGLVVGFLVGGFLLATSSTMFANPQVTLARVFTFAVAGVRPVDGAVFVMAEMLGALAATWTAGFLFQAASPELVGSGRVQADTLQVNAPEPEASSSRSGRKKERRGGFFRSAQAAARDGAAFSGSRCTGIP